MKKYIIFSFTVFFAITVIVIYAWFNTGKIISNTSEENLNILHSQKSAEFYSTFWQPAGTGYKTAFYMARYPTFAVLGSLEQAGMPTYLRQAFLLAVIMLVGMFSMYLLIRIGINLGNSTALIGGLFYSLNVYSLTQIWKRLLYTHMVAWAYLPFFTLLWIKWINTRKIVWLIAFSFSSLFFTYAFSNPVFLLTTWTPAIIYVLLKTWEIRKNKMLITLIFINSIVGVILWSVINFWWLYPTLTLGSNWASDAGQTFEIDFGSLRTVSTSFPIQEILLLRQSWYLGPSNGWNDFYHNPFIILLNIGIFLIFIYGVIKSKGYKYRSFLLYLWFFGFFISKGTNFPFGYTFFHLLFSNFPLTTALRNSYEKFGIVFLFPYAIFFAIGFSKFVSRFNFKVRIMSSFILFTIFCGILVYPIWTGDIFPSKHRVQVPNYYNEANIFLNSMKTERIFHIPFLAESNPIIYDWGYTGIDPSGNIFNSENLSSADVPLYNKTLKLLPDYYDNQNITNIFGLLGVQYIILQRDIIYPTADFIKIQKQIESWKGVFKEKTFGKLDLYSIDKKKVKPIIYISGTITKENSLNEKLNEVASDKWDLKSTFTLQDIGVKLKDIQTPQISYLKIAPTKYIVSIKDSKEPYVLILNNTYDKSWKMKINGQMNTKHFMVNGFANGWYISQKGDYDIEIELEVWPWD